MSVSYVVVDGSNIATEGRSAPSLQQLDEAIRQFQEEFPGVEVIVVVDATFGHRIDASERDMFDEGVAHGELVSPPAGAIGRGDAFVLGVAERVDAQVLSNDSFQEFHAEHPWLFEEGRLIGGKPVPGVGWIFTPRLPVRGARSRAATSGGPDGRSRRGATRGDTQAEEGSGGTPGSTVTRAVASRSRGTSEATVEAMARATGESKSLGASKAAKGKEPAKAAKTADTAKRTTKAAKGKEPAKAAKTADTAKRTTKAAKAAKTADTAKRTTKAAKGKEPAKAAKGKEPAKAAKTADTAKRTTKAAKGKEPAKAAKGKEPAKAAKGKEPAKAAKTADTAKRPAEGSMATEEALGVPGRRAPSPPVPAPSPGRPQVPAAPAAVNDPLTFLTFVSEHPLGSSVLGTVSSFVSHGAMVDVDGMSCYLPLAGLGDPPPRRAREVVERGEQRSFIVVGLDPPRRGAEVALAEVARALSTDSAEPRPGPGRGMRRAGRAGS